MAAALATLLLLAACATSSSSPSPSAGSSASGEPSSSADASAEPAGGLPVFVCSLPIDGDATTDRAQIADVRVGRHDGYDRVVYEFEGAGTPQYTIRPATPPLTADPSGLPMTVNGNAFVEIVLHGATTILPDGVPTYSGQTDFEPDFTQLVQLIEAGDFEAVSSWYAGLAAEGCLRAFVLSNPSRLVIDFES